MLLANCFTGSLEYQAFSFILLNPVVLGKDEVTSSNLVISSTDQPEMVDLFLYSCTKIARIPCKCISYTAKPVSGLLNFQLNAGNFDVRRFSVHGPRRLADSATTAESIRDSVGVFAGRCSCHRLLNARFAGPDRNSLPPFSPTPAFPNPEPHCNCS